MKVGSKVRVRMDVLAKPKNSNYQILEDIEGLEGVVVKIISNSVVGVKLTSDLYVQGHCSLFEELGNNETAMV